MIIWEYSCAEYAVGDRKEIRDVAFVLKKLSFIIREFAPTFHTHALELFLKWVLIIKLGLTSEKKKEKNVFLHSRNPTNQGIIECQKQEKTLRTILVHPLQMPIGAIIPLKHYEGTF